MATEIERKFLVTDVPPLEAAEGEPLQQGYIAIDGQVEVRLRLTPLGAVLTVKGGKGLARTEVEMAVDEEPAADLWQLTAGRRVEKVRHRIALGGATAEVDVFSGALSGLVVAEVEFDSAEVARAFVPPPWFGAELTGRPGWSNAELAVHGRPAVAGGD